MTCDGPSWPELTMLSMLPSDVLLQIFQRLPAQDLVAVARTNSRFSALLHEESLWIARARHEFGVWLKVGDNFSPRLVYQSVLHGYRDLVGQVFQRQNLEYYGGMLRVRVEGESLLFEELFPPLGKLDQPFQRVPFLCLSRAKSDAGIQIKNLSKMAPSKKVSIDTLAENVDNNMAITLSDVKEVDQVEWSTLMQELIGIPANNLFSKEIYRTRALYTYKKLNLSSLLLPGEPLPSGLFIVRYAPYCTEVFQLSVTDQIVGTEGRVVQSDISSFGLKYSVRLTEAKCLNIPSEAQASVLDLNNFLATSPAADLDYQPGLELDFVPPADCDQPEHIPYRSCRGSWLCEVACDLHDVNGIFILYSEDVFAIYFSGSILLYRRVSL